MKYNNQKLTDAKNSVIIFYLNKYSKMCFFSPRNSKTKKNDFACKSIENWSF